MKPLPKAITTTASATMAGCPRTGSRVSAKTVIPSTARQVKHSMIQWPSVITSSDACDMLHCLRSCGLSVSSKPSSTLRSTSSSASSSAGKRLTKLHQQMMVLNSATGPETNIQLHRESRWSKSLNKLKVMRVVVLEMGNKTDPAFAAKATPKSSRLIQLSSRP